MSFRFRLVGTNPFNIRSLPPLTFLVNHVQLTLANLHKCTMSSPQLIVHSRKRTKSAYAGCPFPSVISGEISPGRRKPTAVVPDSCGLCYGYAGQRTKFGVSPGTRKDICIITAAVAAGMTEIIRLKPRFQTRVALPNFVRIKPVPQSARRSAAHSIASLV